ncbi:MAG: hypothetical protein ACK4S4_15865 [Pyrinomonadaceae bacterium]
MPDTKFDPELASEMEWSECVLAASVSDGEYNGHVTRWICGACRMAVLTLSNRYSLVDTAQDYLDRGWRYRRTSTGIDAVCPHCTKQRNK